MTSPLRVLLVEDSESDALLLLSELRRGGFEPVYERVETRAEMSAALSRASWDLVVADYAMPQFSAPAALELLRQSGLDVPSIVVSGTIDEETAAALLHAGAHDFLTKNNLARLNPAVARELREAADRQQRRMAEASLRESEARYRQIFEKTRAVKLLVEPDSGSIVDANSAAAEFYGYPLSRLKHMTLAQLTTPMPEQVAPALATAMAEECTHFVFRHALASGDVRDVEVHATPIHLQGRPLLYAIVHDVTERRQRERELEAISTMATALRVAASRAEMLPIILDQVLDLLNVESAALAVRDPVRGTMTVELARGWPAPAGGLAEHIAGTGQPFWSNAARSDPRVEEGGVPAEVTAVAGVPLVAHAQSVGVLLAGSRVPISTSQVRLLTAIGDIAANAIRRATLHEQTEQRLRRLATLRAIDIAITTSFDLRVTLNVLLDQAAGELNVDVAAVLLLDPYTQTLTHTANHGLLSSALPRSPVPLSDDYAGRAAREQRLVHVPDLAAMPQLPRRIQSLRAAGYRAYYAVPLVARGRITGVLEVLHRAALDPDEEWLDYLDTLAGQAAIAVDNATLFEQLQRSNVELTLAYDATLEGWSRALDLRDRETEGHTRRVTEATVRLALAMGVPDSDMLQVRRGALLHDIGKLGIPDSILLKPGPLTEEEWAIMRRHPEYAYDMLAPIHYLRPALEIPYCHHEKWNGRGYPRGLKGEQIPLPARIFALVDVWDALRSDRPYRPAWPDEQVHTYLQEQTGEHFDPRVVALFMRNGFQH